MSNLFNPFQYMRERRLKARAFKKKLNCGQAYSLKNKIRKRLVYEDYTCRMPDRRKHEQEPPTSQR
jgi:hypothetical protein